MASHYTGDTAAADDCSRDKVSPLCELARKYGSDKFKFYTPFYDSLLSHKRESVRKVVELGIGYPDMMQPIADKIGLTYVTGASLLMWRDYFPNAQIYGLDCMTQHFFREDRIKCLFVDERDPESFHGLEESIGTDVDLIVEDGMHEPWAQLLAIRKLMPLLAEDGIYFAEDIMAEVDMTRFVPYPCAMKEFGEARVMVVRKPLI